MSRTCRNLVKDQSGSTMVEFAILAPAIIGLLFGVFQVGIGMQAQNALRSIAQETSRFAVVEYQKGNEITDATIETWAEDAAAAAPYLLNNTFDATVVSVPTPRVVGTFEKTITLTYTPPAVVPLVNWVSPQLTFSRPIIVLDE